MIRELLTAACPWWAFIPAALTVMWLVLNVWSLVCDMADDRSRRRERLDLGERRAARELYPRHHALDVLPLNTVPENTSAPAGTSGQGA